mgnify:CR=1 FL=1
MIAPLTPASPIGAVYSSSRYARRVSCASSSAGLSVARAAVGIWWQANGNVTDDFRGDIDEVLLFAQALSPAQISQLYQNQLAGDDPAVAGHVHAVPSGLVYGPCQREVPKSSRFRVDAGGAEHPRRVADRRARCEDADHGAPPADPHQWPARPMGPARPRGLARRRPHHRRRRAEDRRALWLRASKVLA